MLVKIKASILGGNYIIFTLYQMIDVQDTVSTFIHLLSMFPSTEFPFESHIGQDTTDLLYIIFTYQTKDNHILLAMFVTADEPVVSCLVAPNRRQPINIWTNDDIVYWRIYASLDLW